MITIACVWRSGGDYTAEYVLRLAKGVRDNCGVPYRLVCLTDVGEQLADWRDCVEAVPLRRPEWPGWWAKLNLFLEFRDRPVVYFDLDTLIRGDITAMVMRPHVFTMLRGFVSAPAASGVMAWRGDYGYIAERFDVSHIAAYSVPERLGDQAWIWDRLNDGWPDITCPDFLEFWQDIFPGAIVDRKRATGRDRRNATVLCYRGRPRPHETGWKP